MDLYQAYARYTEYFPTSTEHRPNVEYNIQYII